MYPRVWKICSEDFIHLVHVRDHNAPLLHLSPTSLAEVEETSAKFEDFFKSSMDGKRIVQLYLSQLQLQLELQLELRLA